MLFPALHSYRINVAGCFLTELLCVLAREGITHPPGSTDHWLDSGLAAANYPRDAVHNESLQTLQSAIATKSTRIVALFMKLIEQHVCMLLCSYSFELNSSCDWAVGTARSEQDRGPV